MRKNFEMVFSLILYNKTPPLRRPPSYRGNKSQNKPVLKVGFYGYSIWNPQDWDTIMEMVQTHDGGSVYSVFDSKHLSTNIDDSPKYHNNAGMDIPAATPHEKWIPFANLQSSSKG